MMSPCPVGNAISADWAAPPGPVSSLPGTDVSGHAPAAGSPVSLRCSGRMDPPEAERAVGLDRDVERPSGGAGPARPHQDRDLPLWRLRLDQIARDIDG